MKNANRSLVAAALLWIAALSLPDPARAQPSGTENALVDALAAQLYGFAGCREIATSDTITSTFFRDVHIVKGRCEAEHGQWLTALVAVDSLNLVYVLDSPSAFRFLLRRHPPVGFRADPLGYAAEALAMMGETQHGAQVIRAVSELPDSVASALRRQRIPNPLTGVIRDRGPVVVVVLSTFTGSRMRRHYLTIGEKGNVVATHRDLWMRGEIH